MARRLKRRLADPNTKKKCRWCEERKAECVVPGQGFAGSYCNDCYVLANEAYKREGNGEPLSEAEWQIQRKYGI